MRKRRRERKRKDSPVLELNMTAMCDVIFLLLIYLILTAHPMDVIANLDVNRPAPDINVNTPPPPIENLVQIMILDDSYVINDKQVTLKTLEGVLKKLASISEDQTVVIKCSPRSKHSRLVQVLDLCTMVGLRNLSVMSL